MHSSMPRVITGHTKRGCVALPYHDFGLIAWHSSLLPCDAIIPFLSKEISIDFPQFGRTVDLILR